MNNDYNISITESFLFFTILYFNILFLHKNQQKLRFDIWFISRNPKPDNFRRLWRRTDRTSLSASMGSGSATGILYRPAPSPTPRTPPPAPPSSSAWCPPPPRTRRDRIASHRRESTSSQSRLLQILKHFGPHWFICQTCIESGEGAALHAQYGETQNAQVTLWFLCDF